MNKTYKAGILYEIECNNTVQNITQFTYADTRDTLIKDITCNINQMIQRYPNVKCKHIETYEIVDSIETLILRQKSDDLIHFLNVLSCAFK